MRRPFVLGAAQHADAHQQRLTLSNRQRRGVEDVLVDRDRAGGRPVGCARTSRRRWRRADRSRSGRIAFAAPASSPWARAVECARSLPSSRTLVRAGGHRVRDPGRKTIGRIRLDLHAERVDGPRVHRERADGVDEVHQLVGVVARAQRLPRRVRDERIHVQLVGGAQQRRVEPVPSVRIGALRNASQAPRS